MTTLLQLLRDNMAREKTVHNLVRNGATEATIYIYDVIDKYWGVSSASVIAALEKAADVQTLHLRINSPGGDVFEGRAIVEAIKRFAGKTVAHIDGVAASAASSIAIAAQEVEIAEGAFFMIHNASGLVWGGKDDMRKMADLLEKVEGTLVADYQAKSGQTEEQIIAWMDAETWFDGKEAVASGFCDRLSEAAASTKNAWNLAAFQNAPKALLAPPPPPEPEPQPTGTTQTNANALRLALLV